jgi:2,4-dienoyl-CoA reductase-like NADH-dependent reductase (Old Yellow Enzyme family)
MASLFDPMHLGDLVLPNRVILSPLSRRRAGPDGQATALMAEYYAQRASAGLIISESVAVARPTEGYAGVPGLWSDDHVEGWVAVTGAVKRVGGRMFAQLWHAGRTPDPQLRAVDLSAPQPRITGVIEDFAAAARRAKAAGFYGVEIHTGKGLLGERPQGAVVQPSGQGRVNAVHDRIGLTLEVIDAAIAVWGPGRVGAHFEAEDGASGRFAERALLASELGARRIAFLCGRRSPQGGAARPLLKALSGRPYIAAGGLDGDAAQAAVADGWVDAVAFGQAFIANPDLPLRLKIGAPLALADPATLRGGGREGYVTYPNWDHQTRALAQA